MPDILMTRIDNRLVHGQVGVAWTTALQGVNLIVVADDLDRWNKHPLQRAMEKFVSSKSANYVNSPFSEDTPGRA